MQMLEPKGTEDIGSTGGATIPGERDQLGGHGQHHNHGS